MILVGSMLAQITYNWMFRKIRFLWWKPFSFFPCHRQVAQHWPVAFNQSLSSTGSAIIDGNYQPMGSGQFMWSLVAFFVRNLFWYRLICGCFATKKWYKRYAGILFVLGIEDFNCVLLRYPINWNCFFRHFNCVNMQIRTLIKLLKQVCLTVVVCFLVCTYENNLVLIYAPIQNHLTSLYPIKKA